VRIVKKKLITLFLALALCMSMAVCAAAAPVSYVVDEIGYLAPGEIDRLNDLAQQIYEDHGVGIFYVYTTADTLADYDVAALVNGMEDYFVMLENNTSWYSFCGGKGTAIDEEKRTELRRVYDATQTYVQGVEDYLNAAAAYFPVMDTPILPSVGERLVFDAANLLTEEQADELNRKLLEVSHQYQAQIFIHTLPSMNGHDIDEYVEYLYDSMGMGYGSKHDGVLLLVSMDPREYRVLSNGFAGDAITTDDIDSIGELIRPHLSDGEYVEAFDIFVEQCRYYIDGHLNGFPFNKGMSLVISLAIGIVVGLIVAKILKGQLKSVRQQHQANNYMKPGSLNITHRNEFFLYSHVSRTPRSKDDSSSGSGSSSGSSRSVGGGSF
jgi:uncharacterized protein